MTTTLQAVPQDKPLPHSDSAERCLLGSLLLDPALIKPLYAEIGAGQEWFYRDTHGLIYRTLVDMAQKLEPVDLATVTQKLDGNRQLERVGGAAAITDLYTAVPTATNWRFHFDVCRKRALLRQLIRAGSELVTEAWDAGDDAAEMLAGCAKTMLDRIHFEVKDSGPLAKSIGSLVAPPKNDPNELIRHRWLCKGGMVLINAPTGVGKSSLVMQFCVSWALAKSVFGITPAKPLKCVILQAENDEGDMAEMRDGVIKGMGLSPDEIEIAVNVVHFREEIFTTGALFCELVDRILEETGADIVVIDPVLHYIGGSTSDQEVVGKWLRNSLMPVLKRRGAGCLLVHHTNKPPTGKEKREWQAGDFAYTGSGSAEWANVPRAVLSLRSVGSHDEYELVAGKRGGRLSWHDREGAKTYSRRISHSKQPGVICWHEVAEEDIQDPRKPTMEQYLSIFPAKWKKSPKESLMTAADRAAAFKARMWDHHLEPEFTRKAIADGKIKKAPSVGHTILVGLPAAVDALMQENGI